MRAAVYDRYGGPIEIRDVPGPVLKPGEVLVRVHAASVNSWDWDQYAGTVMGRLGGPLRPRYRVLGGDMSGVVEQLGEGVSGFAVGDAVAGDISDHGWGGFAEFVSVPEEALVRKPDGVSFEDAAAIPQAGTLALQALRQRSPVRPGERVLIIGGGGGCGSFAIQLARRAGAEVTAVDHGDKLGLMRRLGAERVIDYTREDVFARGDAFDRIIDPVARRGISDYRRLLAPDGALVVIGGRVGTLLSVGAVGLRNKPDGRHVGLLIWRANREDMIELLDLCAAGTIKVALDRIYPLEQTEAALRRVGEGRSLGKVVVRVAQGTA
jgi:NADPH:quinone reductase-like Zn-dependent oxidoreductase